MGRQIELKKITKVFGKLTANSEVDFTVESGKIYGIDWGKIGGGARQHSCVCFTECMSRMEVKY